MNLQIFTKLLAKHLYPMLRQEGFRGSGATLRRVNGPLVHVFNVQGSSGGQRCYLNLGAHLSFLSPGGGRTDWQPDKVLEFECEFRNRIDPPSDQHFGWNHGASESQAEANALTVVSAWQGQGRAFFAKYASFPDDFVRLLAEFVANDAHPASCLTMARIARHLGETSSASAIALSGLSRVSAQSSGLRYSLRQLVFGIEQSLQGTLLK